MNFKMERFLLLFFVSILVFSCEETKEKVLKKVEKKAETVELNEVSTDDEPSNSLNDYLYEDTNLRAIQSLTDQIFIDLKYASTDNFMHQVLYDSLKNLYLQKDVALRLIKCQEYLASINQGLHLLLYDGLRPLSVQQKMWDGLDSIPVWRRVKFVSNPKNGSIHNYGAAIDLTLCDSKGAPLDMGAFYDDIREIAYPRLESHFLSTGELSQEQVDNRKLLRKVMSSQGFRNITTEWWHFNACSREQAKNSYRLYE